MTLSLTAPIFALLFATMGVAASAQEQPAWSGCWGNDTVVVLLEVDRGGLLMDGEPRFYRLALDGDAVRAERWAKVQLWELEVVDGELLFNDGAQEWQLQRRAVVPEELLVEAYPLGSATEIGEERVTEIAAELAAREEQDQGIRRQAQRGDYSDEIRDRMREIDSDNTAFLRGLLADLGWIDATRFGREAAASAFLIVQHSGDLRLQRTALAPIEADARAGLVNGQNYTLLFDRLRLNLGYSQRFGSQLAQTDDGETVLMPLEDPDRVDEYRAEFGMQTLDEYLEWAPIPKPVRRLGG